MTRKPDDISRSGFQRYLWNTYWLFLGQGFQLFVGFFATVAVARWLGPVEFGQLNMYLAVVVILGTLANLGLIPVMTRKLVEDPGSRPMILGTSISMMFTGGCVIYVCMLLAAHLLNLDPPGWALLAILGTVLLLNPFKCIEAWFQSQAQARYPVMATSVAVAVSALLKLYFIALGLDVLWFGVAIAIESVVLALVLLLIYRNRSGSPGAWIFNRICSMDLLRESWPLILSGFSMMIYLRIDLVMLGKLSNEQVVGEYAAATRLSTIWYFLPMLLARSLFPAIVKFKREQATKYHARLQQYFDLNALLAYAVIVPVFVLGPWLVNLIFGSDYSGGGSILRIQILCALLVFLGVARTQVMIAEGCTRTLLMANCSGAAMNVAANFVLIPVLGGHGAAYATILGFLVAGVVCTLLFHQTPVIWRLQKKAAFILFRLRDLIGILSLGNKLRP